jgi:large subunit ribosomal protein L18
MNKLKRIKRKINIKKKLKIGSGRLRLSVFKSNKYIYGQIIDDKNRQTLVAVSEKELKDKSGNKIERSKKLGNLLGQKAKTKKLEKVVFDRSGFRYLGRVKAFAEGAKDGGLIF